MLDILNIIDNWQSAITTDEIELVNLLNSNKFDKKYIFGINDYALEVADYIDANGYIDELTLAKKASDGRPILKLNEIEKESLVINCVSCRSPVTVKRKLDEAGLKNNIGAFSLYRTKNINNLDCPIPEFVKKSRKIFIKNANKLEIIYKNLEDDLSKKIFKEIIFYRMTGDFQIMQHYKIIERNQYFESFIPRSSNEIFIDAGGYKGETSIEFIKSNPNYKLIHFFEPSSINMKKAIYNLKKYKNIIFHNKALSSTLARLPFDHNSEASSKVSNDNNNYIDAVTLDSAIATSPVTFIKMDLEGWEIKALKGSSNIIKKYQPKLALCIYHQPEHFYEIFELVTNLVKIIKYMLDTIQKDGMIQ